MPKWIEIEPSSLEGESGPVRCVSSSRLGAAGFLVRSIDFDTLGKSEFIGDLRLQTRADATFKEPGAGV
jgi:hypothetical protein